MNLCFKNIIFNFWIHSMWQIGVVLPEYRRKGIASALTSRLAIEILERGKVPFYFYCCTWSNLKSAKNAIKSGFRKSGKLSLDILLE